MTAWYNCEYEQFTKSILFNGHVASLEAGKNDPSLYETQEITRIMRYGVGEDGLCEFRHYHYEGNGQLQVLNRVMTEQEFTAFNADPDAKSIYFEALNQDVEHGMGTPSEEEWEEFKTDLVSFPTD